ncbi:hypothetical protein F4808DRAFT_456917 [Astrocystis sublimbata]|nr:hypothetical protein F4808DRAFT_456917 [Astrocystis sublimbata]
MAPAPEAFMGPQVLEDLTDTSIDIADYILENTVDADHESDLDVHHASYFERLPAEIRFQIIEKYLDTDSIVNLALTGPEYYSFISDNEPLIARNMIVSTIGADDMPLAATIFALEEIRGKALEPGQENTYVFSAELWRDMLQPLMHFIKDPRDWREWYAIIKLSQVDGYLELDKSMRRWAETIAEEALQDAYYVAVKQDPQSDPASWAELKTEVTVSEMRRFRHALYIYYLGAVAFEKTPVRADLGIDRDLYDLVFKTFWNCIPPWEYEQVRQVELLLIRYFTITERERIEPMEGYGLEGDRLHQLLLYYQRLVKMYHTNVEVNMDTGRVRFVPAMQAGWRWGVVPMTPAECLPSEWLCGDCNLDNFAECAREIMNVWRGGDDGPKLWWYYDMVKNLETDEPTPQYKLTSVGQCCMFRCAYIFWDLERLKKLTYEKCPSNVEELMERTPLVGYNERSILRAIAE